MLCEKCSKNEAIIHLVCINESEKEGIWLCHKCAKERTTKDISDITNEDLKLNVDSLLDKFLELVDNTKKENKENILKCNSCGLEFEEFEKNQILGCENCYLNFRKKLIPKIKKIHFSKIHKGKIPKSKIKKVTFENNLKNLNEILEEAVLKEEYENAAIIRDKIKEVISDIKREEE